MKMTSKKLRLEQIKYVVDHSNYVKINSDKIKDYAKLFEFKENTYWLNKLNLDLNEQEKILLVFLLESMNFCF